MQPRKEIPTFNIRRVTKKNASNIKYMEQYPQYTPQFQFEKYQEIVTFTNPKKQKQQIIDQSVNEAILNSKTYIDLKKQYAQNKKTNNKNLKQISQQIQKNKKQKQEALEEQQKLITQRKKYQQMLNIMKQRVVEVRDKNVQLKEIIQSRMNNQAEYLSNLIYSMRFQAEYQHDIDPDQMTYEQLLELQDKIGVVSKGLPQELIDNLKKKQIEEQNEDKCMICMCEFEAGQVATEINPCKHIFHTECIGEWLQKEKICPLCKQELTFQYIEKPN